MEANVHVNSKKLFFRCDSSADMVAKTVKRRKRNDIVWNLYNREIRGSFSTHPRTALRQVSSKPLLPKSCFTFCLNELIPSSALLKGHIVLGFSRCGIFLLTYTCVECGDSSLAFNNKYVLHWWACVPHGKAKRVAEVTLFNDQGVDENLLLALCQWPNDNTKMLIYGVSDPHYPPYTPQGQHFYLTVTMVPSLHNCTECQKVAASFGDDDLAANWDSCVRLSCLRHSATVHTYCDIVSPFPRFEPEVSMKVDGTVVINTGNFLHVLRIDIEKSPLNRAKQPLEEDNSIPAHLKCANSGDNDDILSCLMSQSCELTFVSSRPDQDLARTGPHASPIMFLTSPPHFSSEEEETNDKRPRLNDSDSDASIDAPSTKQPLRKTGNIFFLNSDAPPSPSYLKMLAEAEKAYEFTDETPPDEKLYVFRLKRLADKKYEFSADEEDQTENITPFRLNRKRIAFTSSPSNTTTPALPSRRITPQPAAMQELSVYTSPPFSPSDSSEDSKVLRPLNCNNTQQPLASPRPSHFTPELASPGGRVKREQPAEMLRKPFTYLVRLERRYFEVDDEMVSVITDIEDDDLSAMTGYHSALPLEVHGSGYAQMQMVSNTKAEKLNASCMLVQQTSFDIEQFCHEMAQAMCAEAGVKYWFCHDYDVEIVDVCPNSGDVIVVAFLLLQATGKPKLTPAAKGPRFLMGSIQRRKYQGSFVFTWNLESGRYSVVRSQPLVEPVSVQPWHPARGEKLNMRRLAPAPPMHPPVRKLSNKSVLQGVSLSTLVDPENHMSIILN